nr:lytic transglycosylase domain-containing protein [Aquincola sp. J276]
MAPTWLVPLLLTCAPQVHTSTALALLRTESSFNPWAIGVVGGALQRQPQDAAEALATARALQAAGWNFSVGLGQINVRNLPRLGLSLDAAFEPCRNLAAMQTVLLECFDRATVRDAGSQSFASAQQGLQRSLSCYYSGNFSTGFQHGYVHRVRAAIPAVPAASPVPPVLPKEPS